MKAERATAFHIPSLDGIRAGSFLLVFLAHAGLGEKLIPGGFGVTVFFFLSGYLITTLMRLEWTAQGSVSLRQFYLRRALRILPPFYLTLALATAAAVAGVLPGGFAPSAVLAQSLHAFNYWYILHPATHEPAGTGVYWSLAVEEHFYLLFPLAFLAMQKRVGDAGRRVALLYAACFAILVWRTFLVYGLHVTMNRTYMGTDTRVDSILFGCALALYGNPIVDGASRLSESVWKWRILPGAVALLLLTFVYRGSAFRETVRYSLQGIALTPVFVTAIRYPEWAIYRPLNTRAASFLGVLSYSLYLVHFVCLCGVQAHLHIHPVGQGIVALGLSFALASLVYRFIEQPCARLRKRLSRAPAGSAEGRAAALPLASAGTQVSSQ